MNITQQYEDIANNAEPAESFRIWFKTSTYLSKLGSGFNDFFPDPLRLFSNLFRLYSSYLQGEDVQFNKEALQEYKEWLTANSGIIAHELHSVTVPFGKKKATGFKGWTEYSFKELDKWNGLTVALVRFARYKYRWK